MQKVVFALGFPGGTSGKETASMGDSEPMGSILGLGSSLERGNENPLQYSCLENLMDRGAWWATLHRVAKRVGHDLATKQ